MKANRILFYGSTYLTELVIDKVKRTREVVGYVPCKSKPTIPGGNINVPVYDGTTPYDIAISVQYDRKLPVDGRTFNLHTGLLPEYGVGDEYDNGGIISKITYPVLTGDIEKSLYQRQCLIAPDFVVSCLQLVKTMTEEMIEQCHSYTPRLLDRDGSGKDQDFDSWKLTNVWRY